MTRDMSGTPSTTIACVACGTSRPTPIARDGTARTPTRWKRLPAGPTCAACVAAGWSLRAHTLPIAGPVEATWDELRPALRAAFAATTAAANWMLTELYARDVRRQPGEAKLAPMPRMYLYPEARARWPELASQTMSDLEQRVKRTYAAQRYDLLWRSSRTLATLRYPQPIPLPANMIAVDRTNGGAWHLSVRLHDRRWTLRLRTGPLFARQIRALEAVVAGTGLLGAAVLREVTSRPGDHRSESSPATRLLASIVVRQPVATTARDSLVLTVRTTRDRLLVGSIAGQGEVWAASGDALRHVICGADRRLRRIDGDLAVARAWVPAEREALRARRQRISQRAADGVRSQIHQVAAHLVAWTRRRGVGMIVYDDREQGYLVRAPWYRLRSLIAEKAHAAGIAVTLASGEVVSDQAEALAAPGRVTE